MGDDDFNTLYSNATAIQEFENRRFPPSIKSTNVVIIHLRHEMKYCMPRSSQLNRSLLMMISTCGQLQGRLPSWHLDHLVVLNLSFNCLSGDIPDFEKMRSIRFLNLSNNNFRGALINLTALKSLIHLDAGNNKLTGGVNTISWLTRLKYADLSFNELSGAVPRITHLNKLRHLKLNNNRLYGQFPTIPVELETLWLQNNNFEGEFDTKNGGSLASLRLNNNRFSGRFNMDNLKQHIDDIEIYGNQFASPPMDGILFDEWSHLNVLFAPSAKKMISKEYGFLPRDLHKLMDPKMTDIEGYDTWSKLISDLPTLLWTPLELRERIDLLPSLAPSLAPSVDFYYLLRVSCLASNLCHVYYYHGNPQKVQPPQKLKDTWLAARACLKWTVEVKHRRQTDNAHYLSYVDFIVANWQLADSTGLDVTTPPTKWIELLSDPKNLRVLVPTAPVNHRPGQEDMFYMTQTSMLAVSACLPTLVVELQMLGPQLQPKATKVGDKLRKVLDIVRNVTNMFERISLHEGNVEAVTSLFFGRMFASTVIPAKFVQNPETGQYDAFRSENGHLVLTPGPGGQASPFFALMDSFLNRKHYNTNLGHHSSLHMNSYPKDWKDFLIAVRSPHKYGYGHFEEYLRSFSAESMENDLKNCFDLYNSIVEAYLGDDGLLARHLLKLHGYLTGMFRTGREGTIGDAKAGSILNRTEDLLYKSIESSRLERLKDSLPPYSRFVSLKSFTEVSKGSGVWNACLNVSPWCHDVPEAGGHVLLHPKNLLNVYEPLATELREMPGQAEIIRHLISNGSWLRHLQLWKRKIDDTINLSTFLELGDLYGVNKVNIKTKIRSLMPLQPRIYSIAFGPPKNSSAETNTMNLFIRPHAEGVVYNMLVHLRHAPASNENWFPIVVPASPRLLPTLENGSKPIVLFSAGTGISPFLSVIEKEKPLKRDVYFIWFTNICSPAIADESPEGRLKNASVAPLHSTSSNLKSLVVCTSKRHCRENDSKGYFEDFHVKCERDERMQNVFSQHSDHLKHLKSLINKECDIRVCGSSGFVHSVITFLESAVIGQGSLRSWVGSGRLKVEAFSSSEGAPKKSFHPHEILASVYSPSVPLMVLNGGVYKVTQQLKDIHPGGAQIFDFYLGTDASKAFNQIKHNVSNKVLGMMQPYQVGQLNEDSSDPAVLSSDPAVLSSESMRVLKTDYNQACKNAWSMMEIRNAICVEYELHDVLDSMGNLRVGNLHAAEAFKSYLRFRTTHLPELKSLFPLLCEPLIRNTPFEDHTEEYFGKPENQDNVQKQVHDFLKDLVEAVCKSLDEKRTGQIMLMGNAALNIAALSILLNRR
ncbi:hypothetical protein BJ741DRAFT_604555 [Chytriomyces cf. hyalinus JEL632]|nr:hypothetical protein BJ741DRAFT_604555 [Chytriomyces cf. hyalinus JEL632]